MYFVLILSYLEDEVEENEKFQLVLVFFALFCFACFSLVLVMGVQLCRYLICFILFFSSVRYLSCLSVCLSMSVITAILSGLVRVILRYLGYLGRDCQFIRSFKCSKQFQSIER